MLHKQNWTRNLEEGPCFVKSAGLNGPNTGKDDEDDDIKHYADLPIKKSDCNCVAQYFAYFSENVFTILCTSAAVLEMWRRNLSRFFCLSSCSAFILCLFNIHMLS
jgi:hypothetical protein